MSTDLTGFQIWTMASQGASPDSLNQASDVSKDARQRIQALSEELGRITARMPSAWQGKASAQAAQAVQPIEQGLQRAQETLDQADASLRAQAQAIDVFKKNVMPMATPEPPPLTFFDEITPWDTDNEIARKAWFEADANNRRVYAEYVGATSQNTATLPQMPQGPGGAGGANTAVQAATGAGVTSASTAPPKVGDAGATSPSAAASPAGDKAAPPPPTTGGDKTSASNAGSGSSGGPGGGPGAQTPTLPGPGVPKQPGDRTAVADLSGVPGGLPVAPHLQAGKDTAHKSGVPKGDHLGGGAAMLPGGMGIGDPTGTRGQRGPLEPGDRSSVVGKTLSNSPATSGARGAAGRFGAAGMGGFAPPVAHGREEEDREHKRTVYLDEEADTIVGRLSGGVAPVIGEG